MSTRRSYEIQRIESSTLKRDCTPNRKVAASKPGSFLSQSFHESYQDRMNGYMQDDELAIVYYIANLMLLEQHSQADSIIEKQLLRLERSSAAFKGNISRMQGVCKLQILKHRFK